MLIRTIRRGSPRRRPSAARVTAAATARHPSCVSARAAWASMRRPSRGLHRHTQAPAATLRRKASALLERLVRFPRPATVARLSRLVRAGAGARALKARMRENAQRMLRVTREYFGLVAAA